jgi:hypothetical protein
MPPLTIVRALAVISLLLAIACAVCAWRYAQARDAAICWRKIAEEGVAAEGACPAPS